MHFIYKQDFTVVVGWDGAHFEICCMGLKLKSIFLTNIHVKKSKNSAVTITKSPKWYFYKLFCLTNRQNMKSIIFLKPTDIFKHDK